MFKQNYLKLFLISFLFLFIELLVIRVVSTEIRIFAYMSNLVLLAIFTGSGLGMLTKKKYSLSLSVLFFFLISLFLVIKYIVRLPNLEFKLFSGITELLAPLSEAYIWMQVETFSKTGIIIGLFLTLTLFVIIAFAFVPIGQFLGTSLNASKNPLLGYSINIVASLIGMWIFQTLSVLEVSPFLAIVFGQLLLIYLIKNKNEKILAVAGVLATVVLLAPKSAGQPFEQPNTFWSPYQKLILSRITNPERHQPTGWFLETNNVAYMGLLSLSPEDINQRMFAIEEVFLKNSQDIEFSNHYSLPYKFKPQPKEVLIIGGGGGNDAAAAYYAEAKNITVVEIDPTIIRLGKKYHPDAPYLKKNVKIVIDDGRAFLQKAQKKYDLIIMSLADSHTTSSSLTNLRLDNYLYTKQSLQKAKNLLTDDGLLFLSFEVTRPWIGSRIQKTIEDVFGYQPKIFEVRSKGAFGWGGIIFVASKDKQELDKILNNNLKLASFINKHRLTYNTKINPLTDDWPYHYLDKPRLPLIHLFTAFIIGLGMTIFGLKNLKANGFSPAFFFLGIGFMLFEFQNISKSSLLFGTTWTTNLFIITGVLIFILAANFAVYKKIISLRLGFVLLFTTLISQLLIPLDLFNQLSGFIKLVSSVLFLCLPHFFSGIVFANLYTHSKNKAAVFGSNLLGSVFGGLLEMFSFLLGIQALVYFVISFYGLGWLFAQKNNCFRA